MSNNIGQIAYLNAQPHGIQNIYFSGFFIRGHPVTMNTLSYAINYWSKGNMKALFLRHEGYLGAIGAFLTDAPPVAKQGSFKENFSLSKRISLNSLAVFGAIETSDLVMFPLLEQSYNPDSFQLDDIASQAYWIDIMDVNLNHLVQIALNNGSKNSGTNNLANLDDRRFRIDKFANMYRHHLNLLKKEPKAYGVLTVRLLLNLREQCLHELGFMDVFQQVKESDNSAALLALPCLLNHVDHVFENEGMEAHVRVLINNMLAGNMLDWYNLLNKRGALGIQELFEIGKFNFSSALSKVGFNNKMNNSHDLINALASKRRYKEAIIFVDNSGSDFILGVLPFARFLVFLGTHVIFAANTFPSVNDITVPLDIL